MNHQRCPNQTKLLEERLQKGKEAATQLQTLLQHKLSPLDNNNNIIINNHGSVVAAVQMLAVLILRSFTDSLSVLGPNEILSSQIVAADGPTRDRSSDRSSKTTAAADQRKKIKTTRPGGVKDRRGSYKRRNVKVNWIKLSTSMEDEYAWRKYGQKEIQNFKFPRCYFRCTHMKDQGCKAKKQVQRIKHDPILYQTTYFDLHTCKTNMLIRIPSSIIQETIMLDNPLNLEHSSSSCLLNFNNESKIHNIPSSSKKRSSDVIKLDTHSDVFDDDKNNNNNKSSSLLLEYSPTTTTSWLQELMTTSAGSREHPADAPPKTVTDEAAAASDVYSCSSNTSNFPSFDDMDMEVGFSDLDSNLYDDFGSGDDFFTSAASLTV